MLLGCIIGSSKGKGKVDLGVVGIVVGVVTFIGKLLFEVICDCKVNWFKKKKRISRSSLRKSKFIKDYMVRDADLTTGGISRYSLYFDNFIQEKGT